MVDKRDKLIFDKDVYDKAKIPGHVWAISRIETQDDLRELLYGSTEFHGALVGGKDPVYASCPREQHLAAALEEMGKKNLVFAHFGVDFGTHTRVQFAVIHPGADEKTDKRRIKDLMGEINHNLLLEDGVFARTETNSYFYFPLIRRVKKIVR